MQFQQTQITETENNPPLAENELGYVKTTKSRRSELITQVQKDNVITDEDLPDPRLIAFALVVLTAFLFVVAIYYRIINP